MENLYKNHRLCHKVLILFIVVLHVSCARTTSSVVSAEKYESEDSSSNHDLIDLQMDREKQMKIRIEKIEATFNALNKDTMHVLDDFYHPDVHFEDPLGAIEGLPALKDYYAEMYAGVTAIQFEFSEHIIEGTTHVATWTMRMRAKRLNKGREVELDGISLIRFNDDNLVIYHRDYFDVGEMVYEQVPVLKYFVRKIKQRLQKQ